MFWWHASMFVRIIDIYCVIFRRHKMLLLSMASSLDSLLLPFLLFPLTFYIHHLMLSELLYKCFSSASTPSRISIKLLLYVDGKRYPEWENDTARLLYPVNCCFIFKIFMPLNGNKDRCYCNLIFLIKCLLAQGAN